MDFYSGFVTGCAFTLILVIVIQGWEIFRQRGATMEKTEEVLKPSRAQVAFEAVPDVVVFEDLADKPAQGPYDAPVTLVEFSDFHCPYCQRISPVLDRLMKNFPNEIHRVWRHFPLSIHPQAKEVHVASECAKEQGKFWAFHDAVYTAQKPVAGEKEIEKMAKEVGLNMRQFKRCLEDRRYEDVIDADIRKAKSLGVKGTPTLFINGKRYVGARPYRMMEEIIRKELASVKAS